MIFVSKERDACQIEKNHMEKTVFNHKQSIAHPSKKHEKCAYAVRSEADTSQEEKTRSLDQVKMMQKKTVI